MAVGKIPEFKIGTDDWRLYVDRLEQYFLVNAIDAKIHVPTLITVMGAECYELLVNLCTPDKPTTKTFAQVTSILERHLQPKPSVLAERFKFRHRQQSKNESISEYVAVLKRMSKTCEFGGWLVESLRDQLVCGLHSEIIRQRLFTEETLDFAKAYKLAVSMEAAEKDSAAAGTVECQAMASRWAGGMAGAGAARAATRGGRGGRGWRGWRAGAGGGGPGRDPARGIQECSACGGAHDKAGCQFARYVCRVCNRQGHLKRMCPSMASHHSVEVTMEPDGRYDMHVSTVLDEGDRYSEDSDEVFIMTLLSAMAYKPIMIKLNVQGKDLAMQCDTGSAVSCISEELYKQMFCNLEMKECNLKLRYYTGELVNPLGIIRPIVRYNNMEKYLDLVVVRNGKTILLGRQWLCELGIQIPTTKYCEVNNVKDNQFNYSEFSSRFSDVFADGLGRYTGGRVGIHLRAGARPVYLRARPLAYALREPVERALEQLVRDGVLTPVDRSDWATPIVPVVKKDGKSENEVPYLELAEPDEGYHGLIRENETLVEVTPAIRARGPLCSFLILNNKHHGEAPFEIMVIDENEARLRVRFPLNCEKRRNYKFDIAAVGCDGSYSNTVPVHITVTDVNEFAPVFPQSTYVKSVDEGRIYDEIVRVEATDRDCTPRYGDVCKYEILTDRSQPFAIDTYGVIRNTEPLDYEKSHNHILSVVAYDCGMMQSAPVMVTIKVNKPCRAGWKGVAERVDYAPGTGPLALFPAARLEACSSDERCPGVTRIQAAVTLQASRAGSGCDRDTYAVHSQRTICGLDSKTVDLLPSPGAGNEWAKALKPDSGRDGEQMFEFDGSTTAAAVPSSVLPSALAGSFSISTWMRHAPPPDHDKHRKEHVLCLADDHKMNRHHYALFVRNCRLILLLRRDFGDGDLNIFRPAEWRWKIPEVCDNEWHHYAVNVRFPNVELFVDGEPYRPVDGKGPEVIDDWPLHPAHGVNTTLVVGACWQGTEGDMKHYLHGWLAGLGVLVHSVQPPSALKCVAHCREGLSLAPDLYLKSVSVEGDGVADVETLLRRVAYGDARAFPTPGRRNVHVATTITCDNGRIIKAKPAESYIMVLQPQTPSILINGTDDAARDYAHFRQGLRVFPELSVKVLAAHSAVKDAEAQKLDSCVVSVYPALNPDHEALALRSASELPLRYDIRAAVTRDGVILTGSDSVDNYQQVLREIEYSNKKPAYYLNRVFKLTCSELDGRFTSNEYVQTLTVVHPHMSGDGLARELHPSGVADKMDAVARDKQPMHAHGHAQAPRVYAAHAQRDAHSAEQPTARLLDAPQGSATNHVALLIGVIACGVLVLAGGVGVARARSPRSPRAPRSPRHPRDPRAPPRDEMAWDDSALTITLNPMDEPAAAELGTVGAAELSSDGESCDSDSDRHDSSDEDEEVVSSKQHKYRNISQLEWDNSTM